MLIWEYVKGKFVTFVSPSGGSHFAPGARAIYYPSHEAIAFSICCPVVELRSCYVCTGSRRQRTGGRSRPKPQPDSGQASNEELVDPRHSAAADIR